MSGTILVAAGLGWQGAGRQLFSVSLTPILGGRVLASMVLGAIGAWTVLARDKRSLRLAFVGALLILPVLIGAGAVFHPTGRRILDTVMGTSPGMQFLVAVGGFAVVAVLLSAGLHLLIRAFEMGRTSSGRA